MQSWSLTLGISQPDFMIAISPWRLKKILEVLLPNPMRGSTRELELKQPGGEDDSTGLRALTADITPLMRCAP